MFFLSLFPWGLAYSVYSVSAAMVFVQSCWAAFNEKARGCCYRRRGESLSPPADAAPEPAVALGSGPVSVRHQLLSPVWREWVGSLITDSGMLETFISFKSIWVRNATYSYSSGCYYSKCYLKAVLFSSLLSTQYMVSFCSFSSHYFTSSVALSWFES